MLNFGWISDSTFNMKEGLIDPSYVSFESVNHAGYFLRVSPSFQILIHQVN